MPKAVEVTLRVKRGEDVEVHLARFSLPVAAETPEGTTP